jgi:hypothetical protein
MSIFNINSSKKSSNKIRIKHDESIISSSDVIQNSSPNPPYYYLEFLNYIGLILGKVTNKAYYPIFSLGAFIDPGNSYGLSNFIRKYTNDFFENTPPNYLDPDPLENLDFSAIHDHLELFRLQNEQIMADSIMDDDYEEIFDLFFTAIVDYQLEPEMQEILSYQTWNSPEPT